jgi:hypothetical protein
MAALDGSKARAAARKSIKATAVFPAWVEVRLRMFASARILRFLDIFGMIAFAPTSSSTDGRTDRSAYQLIFTIRYHDF